MSALLCNAIADPRHDRETLALIRRRDIGGLWPASASCQAYGDRHLSDGSSTRYGEQLPVPRYPSEFALTPICEPDVRPDDKILDRPRDQDLAGSSDPPYPSGDVDGEPCEIITSDSALAGVQPDDHPWRVDRPERGALPVRGMRTSGWPNGPTSGPSAETSTPRSSPTTLGPAFGDLELARISAGQIRAWYALTSARTPGAATSAYRPLRAIFNTAVTDELVARNPCRIRGPAPTARRSARFRPSPRARPSCRRCRPSCEPPWCWRRGGLCDRAGEVLGLRRDDVDLGAGTVRVERSLGERRNGAVIVGPPKSGAGVRTVHMPPSAMEVLEDHLLSFVGAAVDAPLLVGRTGLALRPQGLEEARRTAREEVGLACPAVPRSAALRRHHGGRCRCLDQGGDGPGRMVLAADGTPLRARHPKSVTASSRTPSKRYRSRFQRQPTVRR